MREEVIKENGPSEIVDLLGRTLHWVAFVYTEALMANMNGFHYYQTHDIEAEANTETKEIEENAWL